MNRKTIIWIVAALLIVSSGLLVAQTITKGLIGKQDFSLWDGSSTKTFVRDTSEGYSLTLNKIDWPGVDVLQVYGAGASRSHTTLSAAISAAGSSVTPLWIAPGTWTIGANTTFTATAIPIVPPGADFSVSSGFTLTFAGTNIQAGGYQIFSGDGELDFADGTTTRLSWFATLPTAIAYIDADKVKIIVDRSETISDDLTIPANVELEFVNGAILTVATTKTLTINGHINAGLYQLFAWAGTGAVTIGKGAVEKVYPQWWGGIPDNTTDSILPIIAATKAHPHVHFTAGVWKITDEIVNTINSYTGGFTWSGDGYKTVIRQTGAGKNVMSLKYFRHPDAYNFLLEGVTVRDMTLIGEAGTQDGLYLEGVLRSQFQNLAITADRYAMYETGTMSNEYIGLKLGMNLFDELPINNALGVTGVVPATPINGLRTAYHALIQNAANTNRYINVTAEGATEDGMVLDSMHGCTLDVVSEANGATGVLFNDGVYNKIKVWSESNAQITTGSKDFYMDGGNNNVIEFLCASNGAMLMMNTYDNIMMSSFVDTMDVQSTSYNNTFINCRYKTTWTKTGNADEYINLTTGNVDGASTKLLIGSATWIPGAIATKDYAAKAITVPGASAGDYVLVSSSVVFPGNCLATGHVSGTDEVTIVLFNATSTTQTFTLGTWRAAIRKP